MATMMDKAKFYTLFMLLNYGERDTLRHSISPLLEGISKVEKARKGIFEKVKAESTGAPIEILKQLDFESFEKARMGFHSLGVSLIICYSELVKKIASDRAAADLTFGISGRKGFAFHQLGPKVGRTFWAEGVVSASNYVRHDEEWQGLIKPVSKSEGGAEFNLDYSGINWDAEVAKLTGQDGRNISTIGSLGVPYITFLRHNARAGFEIANTLSLFSEQGQEFFDIWLDALVKDLQQSLGIK